MVAVPEGSAAAIRKTHSYFVSGVTGGRKIGTDALILTPIDKLRAAVVSELESSSLRAHLDLINSKNQFNMACYVAADFTSSHPLEYQLNVATGQPCGDPVLDWYVRELMPRLWKHFDPLVANMIVVACYDFFNGVGIELLAKDAGVHWQAPNFPDWLRFKTGLSSMYGLLALACASDPKLPTGGLEKFIQTIPDVIVFTNIINDVISFYKELLAGEKGNYIDMCAQKDGVEVVAALRTLADEGIFVRGCVLAALADEAEYRANFDAYAKGITHFRTSSPRYRLWSCLRRLAMIDLH
ncbi:hypothetical protein DL770_002740 [Monosporascus sp. CRB-9-2]|nr:hypothetical protein DL770_002740 [Monosporascus sp. CRB-9-2]